MTALLIGPDEEKAFAALRDLAAKHPVEMRSLMVRIKTREGKKAHMRQMTKQTVVVPFGYTVTFSLETGHPVGTCRHLSMASPDPARTPIPEAVWMVAEKLGFEGSIDTCKVWLEDLTQGKAVNVVQPIRVRPEAHA